MGTREVYEEKLRTGNLHHDPTIIPGRRLRRLSFLSPHSIQEKRRMDHHIRLTRCHCRGIPYLQNRLKGPKWLPFLVGLPPPLNFSGASAAFGGYVLPKFTQITETSYNAASSASHY